MNQTARFIVAIDVPLCFTKITFKALKLFRMTLGKNT